MSDHDRVSVRMFGSLQAFRREQGLPPQQDVSVPPSGVRARDLAVHLGLPVEKIEGVFCNHTIYELGHVIHPGDEVAFVPHGTPGPHRFFLGLYAAGNENTDPDS